MRTNKYIKRTTPHCLRIAAAFYVLENISPLIAAAAAAADAVAVFGIRLVVCRASSTSRAILIKQNIKCLAFASNFMASDMMYWTRITEIMREKPVAKFSALSKQIGPRIRFEQ